MKSKDVTKFGGREKLGDVELNQYKHEVESIETQSKTKIEDDTGQGGAAIIRRFTFGMNPIAFKENPPSKQDLFNYHVKGIEVMLWRDGMKIITEVEPRITLDEKTLQYHIFIGAKPQRGYVLTEAPKTLRQVVHG